jgi:F0F1-type ATP synthase assembly protein I
MVDDRDREPEQPLSGRDLIGLGGAVVAAVVGGLVAGLLLDAWLGTSPVLTLVGVFVGMVAAGAVFWLRVRAAMRP